MIRDSQWKLLNNSSLKHENINGPPQFELYDLLADPGELNNLVDKNPEIVSRLKRAYDRWFDDVSSTRPDNYAPPRIVIGSDHENPTVLTRQDWRSRDGWHRGAIGQWELNVSRAGRYDLHVLLDERTGDDSLGSTIELHVGDVVARQEIAPDADVCDFSGVDLPAGNAQLSVVQIVGEKRLGAYQVFVTKR